MSLHSIKEKKYSTASSNYKIIKLFGHTHNLLHYFLFFFPKNVLVCSLICIFSQSRFCLTTNCSPLIQLCLLSFCMTRYSVILSRFALNVSCHSGKLSFAFLRESSNLPSTPPSLDHRQDHSLIMNQTHHHNLQEQKCLSDFLFPSKSYYVLH